MIIRVDVRIDNEPADQGMYVNGSLSFSESAHFTGAGFRNRVEGLHPLPRSSGNDQGRAFDQSQGTGAQMTLGVMDAMHLALTREGGKL